MKQIVEKNQSTVSQNSIVKPAEKVKETITILIVGD